MAVRVVMSRAKKHAVGGVLVLDNDAINKASTEREVLVYLSAALRRQARVVTSAAVLAEVMRGSNRDAALHRVVGQIVVDPVTEEIGLSAGRLIGKTGFDSTEVVDAIIAATAHDHADRAKRAGAKPDVLVITADLSHLPALVGEQQGITVEHVEEIRKRLGKA
ncbi:PIN domain-containing protein [Actinomadura scrupuli]|uniref:PIN domain-containing protein n=1 Tax=Actinomadura scrupuli TaxID=559629 RepID=UPI003D994A8B